MKRGLKILGGSLLLLLGGIGILIPVLPTTPFVLVAAGLFASAHPSTYRWLVRSPIFGEYISCYRNKTGVKWRTKLLSIVFLWALLLLSIWLKDSLLLLLVLSLIGLLVTGHILLLPTYKKSKTKENPER